ncbi:hypothetical protein [Streptomyces sp. NPDC057280]|uniref:ATP-dependent DNA ligase n=1 Tax=Streptomyces sp. NPDC057280 TaxID=3346081 RepID=UPI003635E2B0
MRAVPVNDPALPAGCAAQLKWDGYRALAGRWADGHIAVRSRNGRDLAAPFPEIAHAVEQLPADTAVDCELVVWEAGRLAFERLQQRMHRRGAGAARAAADWPAHLVFSVKFSVLKSRRSWPGRWTVVEGLAGRPSNTAACQPLANSAGADSGCGQRSMSASHWLVVRGVTPSSFWAEVSVAIERPGMALIAW